MIYVVEIVVDVLKDVCVDHEESHVAQILYPPSIYKYHSIRFSPLIETLGVDLYPCLTFYFYPFTLIWTFTLAPWGKEGRVRRRKCIVFFD
jgi:hypothetical protein